MFLKSNYQNLLKEIKKLSSCPQKVNIVGVSKKKSLNDIKEALKSGLFHIGESYLNEAKAKLLALKQDKNLHFTAHYIGLVQTNKIKDIAKLFDYVHSIQKIKHLKMLNKYASKESKNIKVFVEYNPQKEITKQGISTYQELKTFVQQYLECKDECGFIEVVGIMSIAPFEISVCTDRSKVYNYFCKVRDDMYNLNDELGTNFSDISMGMTADYKEALKCGATYIRIGTLLFGERD